MSSKLDDDHDNINNARFPRKEIPGDYGSPFFGPIVNRFQYFYTQGELKYFQTRMQEHNSTVFRCNMPPGPFISKNSRVICLLDTISFQTLFDNAKVEKKDVLDGTYMPTTNFFGGYRPCAFLDTSEEKHGVLKGFYLSLLAKKKDVFVPLFQEGLQGLFSSLEDDVISKGKLSNFNDLNDAMSFEFVFRLFCNKRPSEVDEIKKKGSRMVDIWLLGQLTPLISLGLKFLPNFVDDLLLHTFPFPSFLVKSDYHKLYNAFYKYGDSVLNEAESLGLKRDEACHNLVFIAGFNAYGGMKAWFPALIKWVATAGKDLHRRLAEEVRACVKEYSINPFTALDKMTLLKSVVYEAFRMEPPVPYQYGHAREDFVIQNHDSSFEIKKGEMLFGYQPIATKDPKVFDEPDKFVPDRFVGEEGEKLIKYVYWSNGREIDNPTAGNKQCPAKDLIVLLSRLMIAELFMRYDTFDVEIGKIMLGSLVKFKSLTKATS